MEEIFDVIEKINDKLLEQDLNLPAYLETDDILLHFVGTRSSFVIHWLNEIIWDSDVDFYLNEVSLNIRMKQVLYFFNQIII